MSSSPTTDAIEIPHDQASFATGDWAEDKETVKNLPRRFLSPAFINGCNVFKRASSASIGLDPWFEYHLSNTPLTSPYLTSVTPRKIINLKEARLLALQILQEAEKERRLFADYEARRGIHWEEEA